MMKDPDPDPEQDPYLWLVDPDRRSKNRWIRIRIRIRIRNTDNLDVHHWFALSESAISVWKSSFLLVTTCWPGARWTKSEKRGLKLLDLYSIYMVRINLTRVENQEFNVLNSSVFSPGIFLWFYRFVDPELLIQIRILPRKNFRIRTICSKVFHIKKPGPY